MSKRRNEFVISSSSTWTMVESSRQKLRLYEAPEVKKKYF